MKMDNEHILVHYETPFEIGTEETGSHQREVLSSRMAAAIKHNSPFGNDESILPEENGNSAQSEIEEFLPPFLTQTTIGQVTLTLAPITVASSKEYLEPVTSSNLLLTITEASRALKISENFTVGEFCQAQSGMHKWSYARIDPKLVEQLQELRTFIAKPISIIDGYYTPKYFREVLKGSELKIGKDPHLSGRGVKIAVDGYNANLIDITVAAIVKCDAETRVSIGNSTMALYVLQTSATESRFSSYIADERVKVETIRFARLFEKLLLGKSYMEYGKLLRETTALMIRQILNQRYVQKMELKWPDMLGDVISIMYNEIKNDSKNPDIILYALAYSHFGYLMRFYFKDSTEGKIPTINALRESFIILGGNRPPNSPRSLSSLERQIDKSQFILECLSLFNNAERSQQEGVVKRTFFDWRKQKGDKLFYDHIKKIIHQVYDINGYKYEQSPQEGPEGGTHRNLKETLANPDRPTVNLTGKYVVEFPPAQPSNANIGNLLLINQAGNFIAGKLIRIFDVPPPIGSHDGKTKYSELKDTVTEFYGRVDEKGAVCNLYPQQTIIISQLGNDRIIVAIMDNTTNEVSARWQLEKVNSEPVLSSGVLDAFTNAGAKDKNFILNLVWIRPLPSQWKKFLTNLKTNTIEIENAITKYYNVDSDSSVVREGAAGSAAFDLQRAYSYFLPNFEGLIRYYKMFYYSGKTAWRPKLWQPTKDKEWMSRYDWIKRMLQDLRDLRGQEYVETHFADFYAECNVETAKPLEVYKYKITMSTNAIGFGPFSKLEGTITVENITDYKMFPGATPWPPEVNNRIFHTFGLWHATLSFSLDKWRPKISAGQDFEAIGETKEFYQFSDFSRALIEMQEWTGIGYSLGGGLIEGSLAKRLVIITGIGKEELRLGDTEMLMPSIAPTEVEIKKKNDDKNDNSFAEIKFPEVAFYRGTIYSKDVSTKITTLPPADTFQATYQLQNTTYFKHDDAELSPAAIEAIGRMCAEELSALTNALTKVEVIGYTDASGKSDYNLTLSNLRAKNTLTAMVDRVGSKMTLLRTSAGLGEVEANARFEFTEKNAWLRKVIVTINGRAVLSLGEI
jgi:outer membrane protein OmpA-like peptidoglycan-associated protein